MYEIIQLNDRTLKELTDVVNHSSDDYAVKIKLTEKQLKDKLESVNTNLTYSFGALYEGRLVGFIINATDGNLAYNVMTGVLPKHRGKGVYSQMFDATLTFFSLYGIDTYQLEVLQTNEEAIRLYTRMGFEKTASYVCFQGSASKPSHDESIHFHQGSLIDQLNHLWHTEPSFSNKHFNEFEHKTYTLETDNIDAFITLSTGGGVRHFGYTAISDFERLISHVSTHHDMLIINNVDARNIEIIECLMQLGFDLYIKQFQMELSI